MSVYQINNGAYGYGAAFNRATFTGNSASVSCGCQVNGSANQLGAATQMRQVLKPTQMGAIGDDKVRATQQMLLSRGFDLGPTGVDGIWGPFTQKAWDGFLAAAFGGPQAGGRTGLPSPANGVTNVGFRGGSNPSDAVNLARQYQGLNSIDVKGQLPGFQAAGGQTNNCADFVTAVLKNTGGIQAGSANVSTLEQNLAGQGWRMVSAGQAQPGDVWIAHNRGHVELVASQGGTRTIGSTNDRPGHQVIKERNNQPGSGVYYSRAAVAVPQYV